MDLERQDSNPCEVSEEPRLIVPLDSRRSQEGSTIYTNANNSRSALADMFTHDVLDDSCTQVRLIELMPAPELDDPIHCNLRKVSFLENENYTAISYVWGDTWGKFSVEINEKSLPITANLDSVLRRVRARDPAHSQILWIDAICINQGDMNEKNHQVSMMRNIYAAASKVLVYLGDSDPDIMKLLDGPLNSANDEDMVGVYKLLELGWWSRIWVFQEFVVASQPPEFGIGNKWISLEFLRRVLIFAQIAESFGVAGREGTIVPEVTEEVFYDRRNLITSYDSWRSEENRNVSLQDLLQSTASRKATVLHDHIYAVIGLLPLPLPELPVDYCMPIWELYQRAMVACIRTSNSLSLVERAVLQKTRTQPIPSWCVDFSTPWYETVSHYKQRPIHRRGGPTYGYLRHCFQQGSLTIMARPLGNVVYVQSFEVKTTSALVLLQQFASSIQQFVAKARICLRSRNSDAEIDHLLREGKLWETVLGGRNWDWVRRKYGHHISCAFDFCIHHFSQLSTFKDIENSASWMYTEPSDSIGDRQPIINVASFKPIWDGTYTMSLTDTGYMVHCKAATQIGDIVCAIPNCVSDVILRPREQQGHIILGPSFVNRKRSWGEEEHEFPMSQLGQFVLY
ncbi:heterokaryon incompatibility protein-domain-containing protein [Xylaria scruposa]|nr:heterokaryon incompatibility protein-domain-containing protein [Xylaria scruposa]